MQHPIYVEWGITVLLFLLILILGKFIFNKLKNNTSRFLNPKEYFPEEELETLKQVYYLIMMFLFFMFILYCIIFPKTGTASVALLEIIIITYIAIHIDFDTWKNKLLFILIVPYGSVGFLLFGTSSLEFLDLFHIVIYLYLIKIYYHKFKSYTETKGLGIAIILLFSLIFLSFIATMIAEGIGPLDSLVMVSNAFTSNGYSILGSSSLGKLNSIFLVWGGYVISGAGTATLAAALLLKHFNNKFDELEKLIKK